MILILEGGVSFTDRERTLTECKQVRFILGNTFPSLESIKRDPSHLNCICNLTQSLQIKKYLPYLVNFFLFHNRESVVSDLMFGITKWFLFACSLKMLSIVLRGTGNLLPGIVSLKKMYTSGQTSQINLLFIGFASISMTLIRILSHSRYVVGFVILRKFNLYLLSGIFYCFYVNNIIGNMKRSFCLVDENSSWIIRTFLCSARTYFTIHPGKQSAENSLTLPFRTKNFVHWIKMNARLKSNVWCCLILTTQSNNKMVKIWIIQNTICRWF